MKRIRKGNRVSKADRPRVQRLLINCEPLEDRVLLSGSNALDRLDFGNLASEAAHNFEPGLSVSQMPILGVGTTGASAGLTYREPFGSGTNNPYSSQGLTFTLDVSPTQQNYITVKVWGSDSDNGQMYLLGAPAQVSYSFIEDNSTPPPFPNRFLYYTFPIPLSMTAGQLSTQLTLNFISSYDAYGGTGYHYLDNGQLTRPVYSAFSTTDPDFIPDSTDQSGTALSQTAEKPLTTLTAAQATAELTAERNSIYNSYYGSLLNRQVLVTSPGSPPAQAIGLDLFTNATNWGNGGKTAAQWDTQIGADRPQPGYTALPTELLSVLYTTYLLAPLPGVTISGEPSQHDPTVLQRIVNLLDGATYMQSSDGQFPGGAWVGLVSNLPSAPTARTAGGSGDLQGVDTQALGWAIMSLLNDSTGSPAFQAFLSQSYNADLTNGGSMLRATAYERMLFNHITYLSANPGGTESQNMFEMSGLYASAIALAKLQTLYPNASYVYSEATALGKVKMVMGLASDTLGNTNPGNSGFTNFGLGPKGLGEANGTLSSGYDGHYGAWLTMLAPDFAALAVLDPGADSTTVSNIQSMARASIDAFDQFIGPGENVTVNSSGQITADAFTLDQEDFITYRNNSNPGSNENAFNVDTRYGAANPSGPVHDAYSLRSAYLEAMYGTVPAITAADTSLTRLNFLRDLPNYEATINSLVNGNPTTLTALPGEPGQPDYAWADPQTGAVAFVNDGERFYMNANWRSYEFNNSSYTNLVPSEIARIDDYTGTVDHAAEIYLPFNTATVQTDGNLSGMTMSSPWYVRYGNYLIVLNHSAGSTTAKLPAGVGEAEDLITHNFYKLGTNVVVGAGQSAIFWLAAPSVSTGADVGSVGVSGSNSYPVAGGTYTVTGSGAGIGGTADALRFVSTSATGNVNLVTQVLSQTNSNAQAQAGLMIRSGTAANAIFAAVVRTPSGLQFEWRSATGGSMSWAAAAAPLGSVWLKLSESSGSVSGFYSLDGSTWTQIGASQSLALPSTTQAGLAVTSANNATTSTAVFSGLVVGFDSQNSSANTAPTIAAGASASSGAVTGTSVNLSVLGADDAGEAALKYTWQLLSGAPVTFSLNASNAAKNTTATFSAVGSYSFLVTVTDAGGLSTTSTVSLTVTPTFTNLGVTPNSGPVYVASGATQAFSAVALDQFGQIMTGTSTSVTWSVDAGGAGSINASGVYTAPTLTSSGSAAIVRASQSGINSGTSAVTISGIFTNSVAVGPSTPAGTATYDGTTGTYTVSGSGTDIWVGPEQFRFLYVPFSGDGTFIAQVTDVSNGSANNPDSAGQAKAGLMFRANLDNESQYATVFQTYTTGTFFSYATTNIGQPTKTGAGATGSGHNTAWLKLVRSGNTFTGYYSTTNTNGNYVAISSVTVAMGATVNVGLIVNARHPALTGTPNLNTSTFTNVALTPSVSVPQFANDLDIGAPDPTGSYFETTGGIATINGGGADIFGTSDQFNFAYLPVTDPDSGGTITITARVVSLVNTNANAKAGVMIRNTLASNSAFFDAVVTASSGINRDSRSSSGASASETKDSGSQFVAPYWVEIIRTGNSFQALLASDSGGVPGTFTSISTQTITMNQTVYVGLAVTSHVDGTLTTATFDHISIATSGDAALNTAPTITTAAAASANPVTTTSANLSVTAGDSDGGGTSNLIYTWAVLSYPSSTPAAVTFSANGTLAARLATVTFTSAGTYVLQVTVQDNGGATVTSQVTVTVTQTSTSIAVSPAAPSISPGGTQQFTAVALDQFGQAMASQPTMGWTMSSGVGSVSASGLFSAPLTGTVGTVEAFAGSKFGRSTIAISNQAPLLANSSLPTAAANPVVGTSTALSVLGVDDSGESNLVYSWAAINSPPAPVSFSTDSNNPTNAAKNTTATFSMAGTYTIAATITDRAGQVVTVNFTVVVVATFTSISVTPASPTVNDGQSQQFTATALDQFNNPLSASFTWTIDNGGAGSVDASGNYTAPATGAGSATVRATSGSISGTAAVNVGLTTIAGAPDVRLVRNGSVLEVYYSGSLSYSVPFAPLGALTVTPDAGNDIITIDFSGGATPVPSAGLTADGGAGTDSLNIIGAAGNNTADLSSSSFLFDGSTINYSNIESVTLSNSTTFTTLSIESGAKLSLGGNVVLSTGQLSLPGTLDLNNGGLILQAGGATGLSQITALLAKGFNAGIGYWNGSSGIISSAAANDQKFLITLGVMLSNAGDVLVKYTYFGDADLNGTVNGADYQLIDMGFGSGATDWAHGDFNYDDKVDGSDYALIDNTFNQIAATSAGPLAIVADSLVVTPKIRTISAPMMAVSTSTPFFDVASKRGAQDQLDELLDLITGQISANE